MTLALLSPKTILNQLGERGRRLRLLHGYTRAQLSEMSGVPESTIKRFEVTGAIGSKSLVQILLSLDAIDALGEIAKPPAPKTIDELLKPARQRGQRSDAGKHRSKPVTGRS